MKALLVMLMFLSGPVFALPHDNRSDVDSGVKVFIPWNSFSITADGTSIYSIGSGNPRVAEVNSLGLSAIDIDGIADTVHLFYPLPDNICIDCPLKVSVVWSTASSTTTQTATWRVLHSDKAIGEALAAASTALDTTISADSVLGSAYMLNETAQGVINGGTFERGDTVHFKIDLSAVSGLDPAASATFIHGIFVEYVRQLL